MVKGKIGITYQNFYRNDGKLKMLGILPLTSFISALRSELVAKLVISVILSSIFFT